MSAQDTLEERYGAPAPWRRRAIIVGSSPWRSGSWSGSPGRVYEHSTPKVTSELETFSVQDDHTVTAVLSSASTAPT